MKMVNSLVSQMQRGNLRRINTVSTYSSVATRAGVVPLSPLPSVSFSITPISNCTLEITHLKMGYKCKMLHGV
jgi:hypothetical protein